MLVQTWPTLSVCSKCGECCTRCGNVRTTATNGGHDAIAETPTADTAKTASGADGNDDDPDDEHEYLNTETDKNIESKKSHGYDIDKQCSKQLLNANKVTTKLLLNTRLTKKQQQIWKLQINKVFNYSKIVLTVEMINVLNRCLNFCILPFKTDITKILVEDLNNPWYGLNFAMAKKLQIQN